MQEYPHDVGSEQACIGAILLRGVPVYRAVRSIVAPIDFYQPAHQEIMRAAERLEQQGVAIDRRMIASQLAASLASCGGMEYLIECQKAVATTENVEWYARQVLEKAKLRRLIVACEDTAARVGRAAGRADEEIAAAVASMQSCYGGEVEARSISSILNAALPEMERRMKLYSEGKESELDPLGVATGLVELDRYLTFDGLPRGTQPTVLGADTSTGKTAFACHVVKHATRLGGSALYCTLEDRGDSMALRMVSAESGLNNRRVQAQRIRQPEWQAFFGALNSVANRNIGFIEGVPRRARDLTAKVRRYVERNKCDLVVVDYLQLFREPAKNKQQQVDDAFGELVAMSLDMPKTATLVVSQLHRRDSGTRPSCADLYHSAAIEQGAHTVLLLWDPPGRIAAISSEDGEKMLDIPCRAMVIAKQKNGQANVDVVLGWNEEIASFFNASQTDIARLENLVIRAGKAGRAA